MALADHHPIIEKEEGVYEQYETLEQQQESYIVGMWTFLVTEIMMFGALFTAYALYRWRYQDYFFHIHEQLNWALGGANTANLLLSSLFVVLAVRAHQLGKKKQVLALLGGVQLCGLIFLGIKYVEYSKKFEHHYFPGNLFGNVFTWTHTADAPAPIAKLFFSMYFVMTGLHGLHVLVGMGLIIWIMLRNERGEFSGAFFTPVENVGLYWHLVDLIWIFLFPLLYLVK